MKITIYGGPYYVNLSTLPASSSTLGRNVLSTLFSRTLNLCSYLNVKDQISPPYRRGKIILLFINIVIFVDNRREAELCGSKYSLNLAVSNNYSYRRVNLLLTRRI
jgi:hypothetical protein